MAGNNNSGRPREDNPKYVQSVRLSVSTLAKVEELSERLGVSRSKILQSVIDSSIDSFSTILQASQKM